MKPKRGGKRKGAGRKPKNVNDRRQNKSVALTPPAWDRIELRAIAKGVSRNDVIQKWADHIN